MFAVQPIRGPAVAAQAPWHTEGIQKLCDDLGILHLKFIEIPRSEGFHIRPQNFIFLDLGYEEIWDSENDLIKNVGIGDMKW